MSLGRVAVFALGTVVGGVIGYAAVKSDTVKKVTKATIKAGLKAKDWTVDTFRKTRGEVTAMVEEARKEPQKA